MLPTNQQVDPKAPFFPNQPASGSKDAILPPANQQVYPKALFFPQPINRSTGIWQMWYSQYTCNFSTYIFYTKSLPIDMIIDGKGLRITKGIKKFAVLPQDTKTEF